MPASAKAQTAPEPDQEMQDGLSFVRQGRLHDAVPAFQRVVNADPRNADAWCFLGLASCRLGNLRKGIEAYQNARALRPEDAEIAGNLRNAYRILGAQATEINDYHGQIQAWRGLLALCPEDNETRLALTWALTQAGEKATLGDFCAGLDRAELGHKILIACMPKSGSSWLLTALTGLTGYSIGHFTYAFFQNEQELHLPSMLATAREDEVIQQHCRATVPNMHLLQGFGIRPIVLVRNIFDALISMHDFYGSGATINTFHHADWATLDRDTRLDLVIETVAPWYVQFYASWVLAGRDHGIEYLPVSYEEMMPDKPAALRRIADFYGLSSADDRIGAALAATSAEHATTRFNKGVSGRGESSFSEAQKDRVRRLARFYPSVDFAEIGLGR